MNVKARPHAWSRAEQNLKVKGIGAEVGKQGSYGVKERSQNDTGDLGDLLEEICLRGFATMEGVISPEDISELNAGLDLLYAIQCEEAGGEENLAKINDLDIVRCSLAYNPLFLTLAINHTITRIAKAVLGEQVVLLMQNGVINRPNRVQCQTKWHRDLNYQHWVSSRPLALSAFVALEDFSTVTGGTVFLPSSHRSEEFPSEQLISRMEVQPECPPALCCFSMQ